MVVRFSGFNKRLSWFIINPPNNSIAQIHQFRGAKRKGLLASADNPFSLLHPSPVHRKRERDLVDSMFTVLSFPPILFHGYDLIGPCTDGAAYGSIRRATLPHRIPVDIVAG